MTKTKLICVLAGMALLPVLFGFSPEKERYTSKEDGFSIVFPATPEKETETVPGGSEPLTVTKYTAKASESEIFIVIATQYPENSPYNSDSEERTAKVFRSTIDGAVNNIQDAELLSEKDISLQGFPGKSFSVSFIDGAAILYGNIYLVHNKVYLLQTAAQASEDVPAIISDFFESFRLMD